MGTSSHYVAAMSLRERTRPGLWIIELCVLSAKARGHPEETVSAQVAKGGSSEEEIGKCAQFFGCNVFAQQVGAQANYAHIPRHVAFLMIDAI
jgi:hypothetical protein